MAKLNKAVSSSFSGVEYTIDEANALRLDAFLCGGASGGESLPAEGFFQTGGVQALAPGINCENFTDKITTLEGFAKLEDLFKGFYTRTVLEFGGKQNRENYSRILYEEWQILDRTWKARVGAKLYEKMRADLIREAEALKAKESCPVKPKGGKHFQMVNMEDEIAQTAPEWKKDISPGRITNRILPSLAHLECTWSAPPKRIEADGFTLTLGVSATSDPKSNLSGYIDVRSGLRLAVEGIATSIEVSSQGGETVAKSIEVPLKPIIMDFLKTGDALFLSVGGCGAGAVHYVYEFRE